MLQKMGQWIPASAGMTLGTEASLILRSLSKSAPTDVSKCILHPFEKILLEQRRSGVVPHFR
jgi:hypothetical protein